MQYFQGLAKGAVLHSYVSYPWSGWFLNQTTAVLGTRLLPSSFVRTEWVLNQCQVKG